MYRLIAAPKVTVIAHPPKHSGHSDRCGWEEAWEVKGAFRELKRGRVGSLVTRFGDAYLKPRLCWLTSASSPQPENPSICLVIVQGEVGGGGKRLF